MIISLDTETTGLDAYHGSRVYLVTICGEDGNPIYWEWPVDPLTRQPRVDQDDVTEISQYIRDADIIVLHNTAFDYQMLRATDPRLVECWEWSKVRDTMYASHLLESILPKGLDDLATRRLKVDINPLEDAVEKAVQECRRLTRNKQFREDYGEWQIAAEGRADMPSAKKEVWKADMWLPAAVALHQCRPENDPYWSVTPNYACKDSEVTLPIWLLQEKKLKQQKLWEWYLDRMKVIELEVSLESKGVTTIGQNFAELKRDYGNASSDLEAECVGIAQARGYSLVMPKGGRSDALEDFCFHAPNGLKLPVLSTTDTGKPSMDKDTLEDLENTLPPGGPEYRFVKSLRMKRARDTALSFISAYERFWVPYTPSLGGNIGSDGGSVSSGVAHIERPYFVLHPHLNPCGTKTTRWSCQNPNEQNISKRGVDVPCPVCRGKAKVRVDGGEVDCKRCYSKEEKMSTGMVAQNLRFGFGPAPGREWWSMDGKNLELRLPAYEAQESEMIALFEQPDKPPYYGSNHLLFFHTIYPDLWASAEQEVGKDEAGNYCKKKYKDSWYQWCKNGNFAVLYGAVDREDGQGTADLAYRKKGAHAMLKARFKRMESLNQYWIRFAEKHGYVETMPDRRVYPQGGRGYPLMCARTQWSKIKPTQPLNYHVQGTACLWMQAAMIRCHQQLEEWKRTTSGKFDGFITMQIHDELVFDLPKRAHPKKDPKRSNLGRMKELQRLMELGGVDVGVPTPASLEYHEANWNEGIAL